MIRVLLLHALMVFLASPAPASEPLSFAALASRQLPAGATPLEVDPLNLAALAVRASAPAPVAADVEPLNFAALAIRGERAPAAPRAKPEKKPPAPVVAPVAPAVAPATAQRWTWPQQTSGRMVPPTCKRGRCR